MLTLLLLPPPLERVGAVCKLTLKLLLSSPLLERVEATGGRMLKLLPLPPSLVSARRGWPLLARISRLPERVWS